MRYMNNTLITNEQGDTNMKLIIEPNPHRGWTSDMINRRLWERIQSGEIDPNDLQIKHTRSIEDACEAARIALKEIEKER